MTRGSEKRSLRVTHEIEKMISVVVPARNEARLIGQTIEAILHAAALPHHVGLPHLDETHTELIVVDNASTDQTTEIVNQYVRQYGVQLLQYGHMNPPTARNRGAERACGRILVFVDADTVIPPHTLRRVQDHHAQGYRAGITWLASLEGGRRAWCWWTFWCLIRCLPLACAKAMPAFMFCTREVYEGYGPFDERVLIGEEWPILAGLYRTARKSLIYDRSLVVLTSSRRMDLQPWGYWRTFGRYVWAVFHRSGRITYSDQWR